MLARRMTSSQVLRSLSAKAANCAAVSVLGVTLSAAMRFFAFGRAEASRMAWLMASTTSGRVSLGAHTAYQAVTSKPGMPISAMLGTSGSSGMRSLVETASARSLSARICDITLAAVE
ncbi:Uncharacterised protein [Bordetella pertussis]|nr:Uncharacterised protein [Bordetella pertussis]